MSIGSSRSTETGSSRNFNISLRPEATASVVRAYIEHGMQTLPGNVKLYYMGPMFRRERPQKGRYRQFYQIGAEVLGPSDAPGIDAEVIEMLMRLFERLKLKGAVLNINSIGDKNCRPAYVEKLRAELQKVREQLGRGQPAAHRDESAARAGLETGTRAAIIEKLPRIAEHLCADCRAHYDEVKRQLGLRGIAYQENWRLVRGLDYYMRTTFEITAPGLGSQNAVCGGGRYDGLVELLGGPATTKGIGFAIGTDRLMLSLQEAGEGERRAACRQGGGPDVYLAWFGAAAQAAAIGLARRLRDAGFVVELPAVEMKFGKSLGLADRLKARHAVIVGDDELAAGVVTVKRLSDGTQQKLARAGIVFVFARGLSSTDFSLCGFACIQVAGCKIRNAHRLKSVLLETWKDKRLVLDSLGTLQRTHYCGESARRGRRQRRCPDGLGPQAARPRQSALYRFARPLGPRANCFQQGAACRRAWRAPRNCARNLSSP